MELKTNKQNVTFVSGIEGNKNYVFINDIQKKWKQIKEENPNKIINLSECFKLFIIDNIGEDYLKRFKDFVFDDRLLTLLESKQQRAISLSREKDLLIEKKNERIAELEKQLAKGGDSQQ